MANDYTTWPTPTLVRARLANLGVTARPVLSDDDIQGMIDGFVAEIARDTLRQFIPAAGTRYFNGSGTGMMEIDDFVTLTTVSILGYIGTAGVQVPSVVPVISQGRPNFRIQIARGSLPSIGRIWLDRFPEGRSNIQVDAVFGYAATIPADLWQAVLDSAAVQCANFAIYQPLGRLQSERLGDVSKSFLMMLPGDLITAPMRLKACKVRYRLPLSKRLRTAKRMV